MADNEQPEETNEAESSEKPPVAATKKAVAKKTSATRKKVATKKKVAVKKKAAARKKPAAKKSTPAPAVVFSASVASAAEKKAATEKATVENRERIQQRLEELGVTPSASRKEEKTGLDDRLFMIVMLGGILFIAAIFAYEYGFKTPSDAEQLAVVQEGGSESLAVEATATPSDEKQPVSDEKDAAESVVSVSQTAVTETATSTAETAISSEAASVEVAPASVDEKAGKLAEGDSSENLFEPSRTFGTARSSAQGDVGGAAGGTSESSRPYPRPGHYYPVPPPYGYYPPHPWWPPYAPY